MSESEKFAVVLRCLTAMAQTINRTAIEIASAVGENDTAYQHGYVAGFQAAAKAINDSLDMVRQQIPNSI